ncbi:MAG: hypothetical protein LH474_08370 [Chamaesiphon sp.]|nr:hypothetical protein [Chamaesiphon sp.]
MRINDPNLLQQVVNYLDKHQEAVRIKKMLYCLCTGRWEKDTEYLNSINFQYLIEQIIRENNTLELLRALLQKLIGTVNKPKQYIGVAKIIYLAIGQLYPEFDREHGNKSKPASPKVEAAPMASGRISQPEPTNSSLGSVPSAFQRAYAPEPTQLTDLGVTSSLQRNYEPLPTQQFDQAANVYDDVDESAYETYCAPDLYEDGQYDRSQVQDDRPIIPEYDPFVLRQNVMSCANPLRAKIILLLMLKPDFNFSSQSVTMMREYQLDDLILEVLKNYPSVPLLEEGITFAVEQLVEIEEYGKAANGLLQSLIPVYTKANMRN